MTRHVHDGLYRYVQRDHVCNPREIELRDAGSGEARFTVKTWEHLDAHELNTRSELFDQLVVVRRTVKRGNVCGLPLAQDTPYAQGSGPMTTRSLRQLAALDPDVELLDREDSLTLVLCGEEVDRRPFSVTYWHGWLAARLENQPYGTPVADLRLYNARNRVARAKRELEVLSPQNISSQTRATFAGYNNYKENYG